MKKKVIDIWECKIFDKWLEAELKVDPDNNNKNFWQNMSSEKHISIKFIPMFLKTVPIFYLSIVLLALMSYFQQQ